MNPTFRWTPPSPSRAAWTPRPGRAPANPLPAGFPSAVQSHYPIFGSYSLAPARQFSVTGLIRSAVFFLSPLLAAPLFPIVAAYLFPRLPLRPMISIDRVAMRPPSENNFFQEMGALGLVLAAIFLLQLIVSLFGRKKAPWIEASIVGGLFAYAAYGVLRGFHALMADYLLFPFSSLWIAIGIWLFLSALILSPRWRSAVS
jgi:hypothetical protein